MTQPVARGLDTVLAIPVHDVDGTPVLDGKAIAAHAPNAITDAGEGEWPARYSLPPLIADLWLAVQQLAARVDPATKGRSNDAPGRNKT